MPDLDPQWIETVARVLWCDVFTIDDSAGGPNWDNVTDPVVRFGMLADAETIVMAVAPLIEAAARADERAKVSEEIAQAIEVKQGRRCPECGGKAAGSKPNGYFIDKRCGGGHTWTSHEHWNAHDWAAIARQHAANGPSVAAAGRTPTPESPGKHDAHNDHDDRQEP